MTHVGVTERIIKMIQCWMLYCSPVQKPETIDVIPQTGHVKKDMVCLLNLGHDNILRLSFHTLTPPPTLLRRMLLKCTFENNFSIQ